MIYHLILMIYHTPVFLTKYELIKSFFVFPILQKHNHMFAYNYYFVLNSRFNIDLIHENYHLEFFLQQFPCIYHIILMWHNQTWYTEIIYQSAWLLVLGSFALLNIDIVYIIGSHINIDIFQI